MDAAWNGIVAVITARIADGSFGVSFPAQCVEDHAVIGTDRRVLEQAVKGYFPALEWPLNADRLPEGFTALDVIEFTYQNIGSPIVVRHHPFYRHDHVRYEKDRGRAEFREQINLVLTRNRLAYELGENGQVVRLVPPVLKEALSEAAFKTGDGTLDEMLETARQRFLSHDPIVRKEALERLWDAWERLKTIEAGDDKKETIKAILDKVTDEPTFRAVIEGDASSLTKVGNDFMIRHWEKGKIEIKDPEQVDYFFHRLFALIRLLLRKSGRAK
jgi:hypothetical protein